MGHRVRQTIYTCDVCGETPEHGEPMWEMGSEVWCKDCCEKQENESDEE